MSEKWLAAALILGAAGFAQAPQTKPLRLRMVIRDVPGWVIKDEERKDALIWALRTRVLTPKEMDEVQSEGDWLYMRNGINPPESELRARMNADLLQQLQIRLAVEKAEKDHCGK